MSAEEAFSWCATEVRRVDYDRYLSVLFAPKNVRPHLFALYAVNHEIAKTAETVREPLAGAIRLQWWREAFEELYAGKPRAHEALLALAETLRSHDLPRAMFDAMLGARELDLEEAPFADMSALEAYADATSSIVMRLASHILGNPLYEVAREAGIAYAMTGLLRALPFRASRRRSIVPRDAGVDVEELFNGKCTPALRLAMDAIIKSARSHFDNIAEVSPAVLPAALCPLYLRLMARESFNPFRDSTEVPPFRRQCIMLRAHWRGRL